jgi:antitoxin component YwqK of YwqJK toxin-antitoxin module
MKFVHKILLQVRFLGLIAMVPLISCHRSVDKIIARFPNGSPLLIYRYPDKRDTLTFVSIQYYSDGKIHKVDSVENSMIIGTPIIYYPDGKFFQIDSLFKPVKIFDTIWDGTTTRFYENGRPSDKFIVKRGIVNGMYHHYDMNGALVREYFVVDTIKNGIYREFYKNGKVKYQGHLKNDMKSGAEYYFSENGDTSKYNATDAKGDISFPYKRWLHNGTILEGNFADSSGNIVIWRWFGVNGIVLKKKIQHLKNKMFASPEPY